MTEEFKSIGWTAVKRDNEKGRVFQRSRVVHGEAQAAEIVRQWHEEYESQMLTYGTEELFARRAAPSQPEGAEPTAWRIVYVNEFLSGELTSVKERAALAEYLGYLVEPLYLHPSQSAGAAAPDEGADDPLAKAILKGLTSKQLRDKALYLMALNANQARTIDALQADKYCSQCRKTKGADPALGADLHKFMDAAAGEGLVLDGVDAADLYVKLFPAEYAALSAPKGEAATPSSQGGRP